MHTIYLISYFYFSVKVGGRNCLTQLDIIFEEKTERSKNTIPQAGSIQ